MIESKVKTNAMLWLYYNLNIIVLILFFGGGCSLFNNANAEPKSLYLRKVILEINSNASDSSFPQGQTLDIRLYDNMAVEFDFYLPNTPERVGMKFTKETKVDKLSQANFDKIISLINESSLLNAKSYYEPVRRMSVDSFIKKTVIIKANDNEKRIVLEERDSHLHLKDKTNIYPESLIKLLELVEKTNKELRKKIDPESR
jgi:hypothetical protein